MARAYLINIGDEEPRRESLLITTAPRPIPSA
jgi:hypothetical protein